MSNQWEKMQQNSKPRHKNDTALGRFTSLGRNYIRTCVCGEPAGPEEVFTQGSGNTSVQCSAVFKMSVEDTDRSTRPAAVLKMCIKLG